MEKEAEGGSSENNASSTGSGGLHGEATSEHSGHLNTGWEPDGDIWGRMGPRRGASKDVMGDAGGDSSQGRPCPRAVRALSWLPFYR